EVELVLVTILIDVVALDIFQDQICLSSWRDTRIHQLRDMFMRQSSENAALSFKAFFSTFPRQVQVDKLHSHTPLEPAITALGEPDASHSTLADLRDQRVGPNGLACKAWPRRGRRALFQKTFPHQQ